MSKENDADKRPRVYLHSSTSEQEIEVTVQGAEGETSDDVKDNAEEMYDMVKEDIEEDDEVSKSYD
jgi:hypothetical protein